MQTIELEPAELDLILEILRTYVQACSERITDMHRLLKTGRMAIALALDPDFHASPETRTMAQKAEEATSGYIAEIQKVESEKAMSQAMLERITPPGWESKWDKEDSPTQGEPIPA